MVSSYVTNDSNTCFWLPRQSSKIFWQHVKRCSFWIEERSLGTQIAMTFFMWRCSWMIRMTVVLGISSLTEIFLSVNRLPLSSFSSIRLMFSSVTTSTGRHSRGSSSTLSLPTRNCLAHSCTVEYEGEALTKAPSKRCLIAGASSSLPRNLITMRYSTFDIAVAHRNISYFHECLQHTGAPNRLKLTY